MITEKLSGLYTKLEDKYFDALDFFDKKGIPVYNYSDFFEKKGIPSFVVTVAIIVAIIAIITLAFTYQGGNVSELIMSLKDADGNPLVNANLKITDASGNILFEGKASDGDTVKINRALKNGEVISLYAELEGYQPASAEFTVGTGNNSPSLSFDKGFTGVEATVRIIDSETKTIISGATVLASTNNLTYQFNEDQNGAYRKAGVPSGVSILLKVDAEGYNSYSQTVTFNEGQVREVQLTPSDASFVGNATVQIQVIDSDNKLVDLAHVTITNTQSDVALLTGYTQNGVLTGSLQAGVPLKIVVEKQGYLTYNSDNAGGNITIRKSEAQISITLTLGGQNMHVSVTDEQSGFGLEGATAQIFTESGVLLKSETTTATGVDFSGLDSNGQLYFTAQKEGYLPARQLVQVSSTETVSLALKRVIATNSARLDIYSIDSKLAPVNGVKVMIYDTNGSVNAPYGIPQFETGFAGYANATVETGKTYVINGFTDVMEGKTTVEVKAGEIDKKVYLNMAKKSNIIEMHFIDVFGGDISGSAVISGLDGTMLFDGDLALGSAFFDGQQKQTVSVKVTGVDQNVFSENVAIGGKDYVEVVVYDKGSTALAPTIEFVKIENEKGDEVKGITPGAFYFADFAVSFPRAATQGGVHFRTGEDNIAFAESEKIGVYDLSFGGATIAYSQSYTPTPAPGNEAVDRANSGAQGSKNKWVEGIISSPIGTYTVKVKIRAEDFTAGKVQLKYRAWAIASGDYYRTPADDALGTKILTETKSALYATTNSTDFVLYESLPDCKDNICITTNFVDADEKYYAESGFEAIKDKEYAIEAEISATEADYIQVVVTTDSNINFSSTQTGSFAFAVDRTGGQSTSLQKKTASAAVSLAKDSKQKLRFYFTPNKIGSASIKITATGKSSVEKNVAFNVVEEKTLLVELSLGQIIPGRNFSIKVTDSGLKGVPNAFIKILDKDGKVVKSIEGDGTNGKGLNGNYSVMNNLSPGLYTVEVSALGFKSNSVPLLITIQNILTFPDTLEAIIEVGQKTALLNENLTNTSDFTVQSITIQTDSQEIQDNAKLGDSVYTATSGKFKIKASAPIVMGSGQTQQVQITVTYLGTPTDTADETANITISGMVEGKFLTKVTSSLHMVYNRKLDPACLKVVPTTLVLNVLGTQGATDSQAIELTNTCDTALLIPFAKEKIKEKTVRSFILISSEDIDLRPGETKNINITATNLIDRGSARQETFGFDIVYDSNYLKKTINVNVQTINPLFALNYPPQVTLFLAQPNISEKASAAQPIFVSNISAFPVNDLTFVVDKDYASQASMKISVEPSAVVSLLPGQAITPPKVVFAQSNSKITEPVRAKILISGSMGQLNNRTGQSDNYNYYANYLNGTAHGGNTAYGANAIYGNSPSLNSYSSGSSPYYSNVKQTLGAIDVIVYYSGYNCLQAHLTSDEGSFLFSSIGGQIGKIISISNTCAEPVRVLGAIPAASAQNPNSFGLPMIASSVILSLPQITVAPGETAKVQLSVMTAVPNMKRENYQIVISGVSEISQTQISSKPFAINIYSGLDTASEHVKASLVNVKVCQSGVASIDEQVQMPKTLGTNCAENYCDAKDAATYLGSKILSTISKAQSQGYTMKNKGDAFSCQNTEGACTFEEIGMLPEQFDLYLQNDYVSATALDRVLNNKEMEGVNSTPFRETSASTGFMVESRSVQDFAFLKPMILSGYDRRVFIDRELAGCGYYRVTITGVFKAGLEGLETMTPIIAVKVVPINGKARLLTSQCTVGINNIANFNPVDKGLNPGNDLGTWMTTVTTDAQLTDIAKKIAKARYSSDLRVGNGNGNIVKLQLGALQGSLAQMCVGGSDKKTITVTIDSAQMNIATTKDAFSLAVIKMVSDALNGSFGTNCLIKEGDVYRCINLSDPGGSANRKLAVLSDKIQFISNKESCVSGTIYSNYLEELNFDITPNPNNTKDFVGIRKITISTDDTKNMPIVAISGTKTSTNTSANTSTGIGAGTTTPATPATPSGNPLTPTSGTTPAKAESANKQNTIVANFAEAPTAPDATNTNPTINALTDNTQLESGALYEYVVQGGNLDAKKQVEKYITLKKNTTSKDYAYYRNIKICASPSDQVAAGTAPQTAYIQANGVQFEVSIKNLQHGESNATTKDSKAVITIQTGTLHPEDLMTKLCSGLAIGEDKPYYFTLAWQSDGESNNTFEYSSDLNGLKNAGKLKTCPNTMFDDVTGGAGTDQYDKTLAANRGLALGNYAWSCALTSLACNTMITGVGGAYGAALDCGIPIVTTYKNDLLLSTGLDKSAGLQSLKKTVEKIPLLGKIISDFLQAKETPPEPVSFGAEALSAGPGVLIKSLTTSQRNRLASGFADGFWSKKLTKDSIKDISKQVGAVLAHEERVALEGALATPDAAVLSSYETKIADGFAKSIEKDMVADFDALSETGGITQKLKITQYSNPELATTKLESLKKALDNKAALDAVREKVVAENVSGAPLIKRAMGLSGEVTTTDMLARISDAEAQNIVRTAMPAGQKTITDLIRERLLTGQYGSVSHPTGVSAPTVVINMSGAGTAQSVPNLVIKNSLSVGECQSIVRDSLKVSGLGLSDPAIEGIVSSVTTGITVPAGGELAIGKVASEIGNPIAPIISRSIPNAEIASIGKQLAQFSTGKVSEAEIKTALSSTKWKNIFAQGIKFGKVVGCGLLANVVGGFAYNTTIDTTQKSVNLKTIKSTNENFKFEKNHTYKLVISQIGSVMTTFTDVTPGFANNDLAATMERDLAKRSDALLVSTQKTPQDKTPEERPLEQWLMKTNLITAKDKLKNYTYAGLPQTEIDKHLQILTDQKIQKLIYLYTAPETIAKIPNPRYIKGSDEGLAIAIMLFGWNDGFSAQVKAETTNFEGWLKDKLQKATTARIAGKNKGEDIARTAFPELIKSEKDATDFAQMYAAWQAIAYKDSPSAKPTS
ncbi:MAG: hypothetical protein WCI04_00770 [archaeon]